MLRSSVASLFWRYAQGRSVVYVEGMGKQGFFFSNNGARLRVTSSNTAHGEVLENASYDDLPQVEIDRLQAAMRDRRSLTVWTETHVAGYPWKGTCLDAVRITKVPEVYEPGK